MSKIIINTNEKLGKIKPLHAVNNGPVYKFSADQQITNIDAFRDAGIPYARNHDASFYSIYGGNHTVDINFIFPDFDKDPYDENSYDFAVTDEYIRVTEWANTRTFYRLGARIEHEIKKYNTLPPKDFQKWAVVCEHIIKHYTQGWANGFNYDMEYWEIWNEPDLTPDDSDDKKTWGGSAKQFYELFNITLKHLKSKFPNLKIGGPAAANVTWADKEPWVTGWFDNFFKSLEVKPDFFSWHNYNNDVNDLLGKVKYMRNLLNEHGLNDAESILNEWNYVKGWTGEEWFTSLKTEKSLKGSAFIASVMCGCQYEDLDMLMYYDARPCGMNGMFNTDFVCECLKGYYPFKMFNELYKLKNCVALNSDNNDIKACGAVSDDENELDVMISYFNDDDNSKTQSFELDFTSFSDNATVDIYVLDEENDMTLLNPQTITNGKINLDIPLFTTYLLKIKK